MTFVLIVKSADETLHADVAMFGPAVYKKKTQSFVS